jgi:DNA-binding Xre family transcriptional regulator
MKQTNHSYRTLAQAARQGKSPIQRLVAGKQKTISYPNAERIAKALKVDVSDLFRPKHIEGE